MLKDVHSQMPQAICEVTPENVAPNLLITRKPPFDNLDLRRAIAMTIDHKAFIDILGEGQGDIGTAMLPAPEGLWAMPKEMMEKLPGYDPDLQKSREEARKIMQSLGYGPDKRLAVKISARNLPIYRDPAAILSDQLKQIWIDTEIELVETANWLPRLIRGDFTFAQSLVGSGLDDPDQNFYENYICDFEPQLHEILQPRARQADRPAIDGTRPGKAQASGLADRQQIAGGCGAADPLPHAPGHLLAPRAQGPQPAGQQHL